MNRTAENPYPPRLGPGVPVLDRPSGVEKEGKILVRRLGHRLGADTVQPGSARGCPESAVGIQAGGSRRQVGPGGTGPLHPSHRLDALVGDAAVVAQAAGRHPGPGPAPAAVNPPPTPGPWRSPIDRAKVASSVPARSASAASPRSGASEDPRLPAGRRPPSGWPPLQASISKLNRYCSPASRGSRASPSLPRSGRRALVPVKFTGTSCRPATPS
jgi:hypothetical protein